VLVPGDIVKSLEIIDFQSNVTDEKLVLTTRIESQGNVSVDTDIATILKYFFGMTHSNYDGQFPVLRGEIGEWNFDHPRPFWGGWYRGEVSATYDPNPDNYLGEQAQDQAMLTYPSIWIFVWPQPIAIAVEVAVLFVLLGGFYYFMRRLKQKIDVRRRWKRRKVLSGEDIKSVAKVHNISWRRLARVNKLKAPYTIKTGDVIKVPPLARAKTKKNE